MQRENPFQNVAGLKACEKIQGYSLMQFGLILDKVFVNSLNICRLRTVLKHTRNKMGLVMSIDC